MPEKKPFGFMTAAEIRHRMLKEQENRAPRLGTPMPGDANYQSSEAPEVESERTRSSTVEKKHVTTKEDVLFPLINKYLTLLGFSDQEIANHEYLSESTIKQKYRQRSHQLHPDVNKVLSSEEAAAEFIILTEARDQLLQLLREHDVLRAA